MQDEEDLQAEPDELTLAATAERRGGVQSAVFLMGGALAVLFGLATAGVMVFLPTVPIYRFTFATVPPTIGGVLLLGAGIARLRTATRVTADDDGLTVERGSGRRDSYDWDQLAYAEDDSGGTFGRTFKVYDTAGRCVANLRASLQPFDLLVTGVKEYLNREDDAAHAAAVDRLRLRKNRRVALHSLALGLVFAALAAFLISDGFAERRAERLLNEQGVPGTAEIVELFLAPNGITPRLVYRVTPDSGERNVEVPRAYWDALHGQDRVPVVYVVSEPSISRAPAEIADEAGFEADLGPWLPVLFLALPAFLIGSSVFLLAGWDLRTDEATGRLRLRRLKRSSSG